MACPMGAETRWREGAGAGDRTDCELCPRLAWQTVPKTQIKRPQKSRHHLWSSVPPGAVPPPPVSSVNPLDIPTTAPLQSPRGYCASY